MTVASHLYDYVKRALDVLASSIALLVLSPIMVVTSLLVAAKLGTPVVFTQERPGKNNKIFTLLKFRSMRPVDEDRGLVTNADRLTPFGARLRSTSLDELPSLWNIFRGDMSFVGPRPLRVSYLDRYSPEQTMRHAVRPGLTGLAQVRGRNSLSWDERLAADIEYVNRRSFFLDARVILATFRAVFVREGISDGQDATMSEFFGPESTRRLRFVELNESHLDTRVAWLSDETVRSGVSISFSPDIDSMRVWFNRANQDKSRCDWVAVDRVLDEPVAMCGLQHSSGGEASLYIYVAPGLQRRGYGRESMLLLTARAREAGVELLHLETPANNFAAQKLYSSLGFAVVGRADEGTKIEMVKSIMRGHANA